MIGWPSLKVPFPFQHADELKVGDTEPQDRVSELIRHLHKRRHMTDVNAHGVFLVSPRDGGDRL